MLYNIMICYTTSKPRHKIQRFLSCYNIYVIPQISKLYSTSHHSRYGPTTTVNQMNFQVLNPKVVLSEEVFLGSTSVVQAQANSTIMLSHCVSVPMPPSWLSLQSDNSCHLFNLKSLFKEKWFLSVFGSDLGSELATGSLRQNNSWTCQDIFLFALQRSSATPTMWFFAGARAGWVQQHCSSCHNTGAALYISLWNPDLLLGCPS